MIPVHAGLVNFLQKLDIAPGIPSFNIQCVILNGLLAVKDLARSGQDFAWQSCRCTPDPSGLKSLRMTPEWWTL
jgi:hypothetical protein